MCVYSCANCTTVLVWQLQLRNLLMYSCQQTHRLGVISSLLQGILVLLERKSADLQYAQSRMTQLTERTRRSALAPSHELMIPA